MKKYVIGIDEVGRGALAGPIVVAAAKISPNRKSRIANRPLGKLRDSKKLSPRQRAAWFAYLKDHPAVEFAIARIYPRRIERMNISRAANLAAERACKKLIADRKSLIVRSRIFLDGGLFLGNGEQPRSARTVVKGDEKIPAIAVASIIAKVTRDRFMVRLAKRYPAYGFEVHKGYGTKAHYKALRKHGSCDTHRSTFL
jgi:ribonuclease HII